jgi:sulfite reductase beta subunit-like hemoprotein
METKLVNQRDNDSSMEYREAVKRLIETEVGNIIDEEIRKAARELIEEQRKAIREAVEQHKLVIRQVVEEEKRAIWARVEELRKSIVRLGMG